MLRVPRPKVPQQSHLQFPTYNQTWPSPTTAWDSRDIRNPRDRRWSTGQAWDGIARNSSRGHQYYSYSNNPNQEAGEEFDILRDARRPTCCDDVLRTPNKSCLPLTHEQQQWWCDMKHPLIPPLPTPPPPRRDPLYQNHPRKQSQSKPVIIRKKPRRHERDMTNVDKKQGKSTSFKYTL